MWRLVLHAVHQFTDKEAEHVFSCPACDQDHLIHAKSFLKNVYLAKLSEKKASQVTRGPLAENLKAHLDELKQNSDKLALEVQSRANKISEHCSGLRSELNLSSDQLIETIKKYNSELNAQIDEYELSLSAIGDIGEEHETKLEILFKETLEFHSKWTDYLNQFDLDDVELNSASAQLNIRLNSLNSEREILLYKIFNNRLLVFAKNETKPSSSIIGTLEDSKSLLAYQKQLDQLRIHKLKEKQIGNGEPVSNDSVRVQCFDDQRFCIAYRNDLLESYLYLGMFDSEMNELRAKNFELGRFEEFKLAKMKNWIILCIVKNEEGRNEADSEEENDFASSIRKLDQNLMTLSRINVDYEIRAVETFESSIFCLSAFDFVNRFVYAYDQNLVQIMSVGQREDLTKPYFISSSFRKMKVTELYFVFLDGKQVVFMNRFNGMVEKKFNFESFEFEFYDGSGLNAFKYDSDRFELLKYDFNGYSQSFSLSGARLSGKTKRNMRLINCFNGKFLFFDKHELTLIF